MKDNVLRHERFSMEAGYADCRRINGGEPAELIPRRDSLVDSIKERRLSMHLRQRSQGWRKQIIGVTMTVFLLASDLVASSSAQAAGPIGVLAVETYRNAETNNCLDGDGSGQIYPHMCNGGDFQRWEVINNGDDTRTFKNVATGLCLDGNESGGIYGHVCNGGNFQRWYISLAFGFVGFESKQTKRCVRDAGSDITAPKRGVATCAVASSRQRWG